MSNRVSILIVFFIAGVLLICSVILSNSIRINTTASMPIGLWHISTRISLIKRGQIVFICPVDSPIFTTARERGYISHGRCGKGGFEPLLKPVAAIAGDKVTISSKGIAVNGKLISNSSIMRNDSTGRSLPQMPDGTYIVPLGMVWVIANHNPASFDSRYFGPLPIQKIQGIATPIWVTNL